jgi:putative endonuclease
MVLPRSIGDAAEALVADYLAALGWQILARNLRLGRKEVDILAADPGPPGRLVLVEVRARGRRDFGLAEETFDWRKRRHLRAALGSLAATRRLRDGTELPRMPLAVDLVVVEPGAPLRHHRDALTG